MMLIREFCSRIFSCDRVGVRLAAVHLGFCGALALAVLSPLTLAVNAHAAVVSAIPNQEIAVPVNTEMGAVVQFALPVKTVTPSKLFSISDFSSGVSPTGQKMDVRSFMVKPAIANANESVTFVLAGGKTAVLRFIATAGGEKFFEVHINASEKKVKGKFLSQELNLIRSMLKDGTGTFARELRNVSLESAIPRTQARLLRVYRGDGITGFVLNLENHGKSDLLVEPSMLSFGNGSAPLLLSHITKSKLSPCPIMKSVAECSATVRVVVRGSAESLPALDVQPFVKSNASLGGGE
jgi:hypothetical protein